MKKTEKRLAFSENIGSCNARLVQTMYYKLRAKQTAEWNELEIPETGPCINRNK